MSSPQQTKSKSINEKSQGFRVLMTGPPEGIEWALSCSLQQLIKSDEVMEAYDEETHDSFTRVPTAEEWAEVQFPGRTLLLPYNWRFDYPEPDKYYEIERRTISEADWAAGVRWTLRKCVDTMRHFYGKNKRRNQRSLGDHQFFEGFFQDGMAYFGS